MRLFILVFLFSLTLFGLVLLVIALTDIYPVLKLKEYGFVIGIVFISLGGFTRQAYTKWKEQLPN